MSQSKPQIVSLQMVGYLKFLEEDLSVYFKLISVYHMACVLFLQNESVPMHE